MTRRPSGVSSPCCLPLRARSRCVDHFSAASATASPVDVSMLSGLPAQRGAASARLVGYGPVSVYGLLGLVPFPCSLSQFSQCVCLLTSGFSDSVVRLSAIPPPPIWRSGVGGGRFAAPATRLAAPAPLAWFFGPGFEVSGLRRAIGCSVRFFPAVLPLLLRVLRVSTGFFCFGLCFASGRFFGIILLFT